MLEHLDFHALLTRWSAEAIDHRADLAADLPAEAVGSGWIGRAPADANAIAAAESRLGVRLPPSLREFYSVTDGWPVTSFDFGSVVPVGDLGWFADKSPDSFEIWTSDSGDEEMTAILSRALVMSDGTDTMLLAADSAGPDGEWPSFGLTSWYPGLGDRQPDFRAGLESHYASFVRFTATDSSTHEEVTRIVERAYRRLLAGDLDVEPVVREAPNFGSTRASLLLEQLGAMRSHYRAGLGLQTFADQPLDDAFEQDLWPMFVASSLDPHDRYQSYAVERILAGPRTETTAVIARLVEDHRRTGGLRARYDGEFGAAVERVRALVRGGRLDDAWDAFAAALPLWRPASPHHLAPLALAWDADLVALHSYQRGEQILRTARG